MSYNNPEYGGGGSTGANYYDPNANFSDTRYTGPSSSSIPDFSSASSHARSHHDGGNSDLFSNALSFIKERASGLSDGEVDEQHAVQAHQALYGGGEGHHDSGSVGAGAALQALKMFMSGEGGAGEGGFDQNKLMGIAMAQAGKLWDEKESQGVSMVSFDFSSRTSLAFGFVVGSADTVSSLAISSLLLTTRRRWR